MTQQNLIEHLECEGDIRDLECEICLQLMVNPHSCAPCGHTFCKACVDRLQRRRCPKCRADIAAICRNAFAQSVMASKNAKCKGCGEQFPLTAAETHVNGCGKIETECGRCKATFLREAGRQHEAECPMALLLCNCGLQVPRREFGHHQEDDCPKRLERCPFQCGESCERLLIPSHTISCGAVMSRCPIEGCLDTFRRKDEGRHLDASIRRHFEGLRRAQARVLWEGHTGTLTVGLRETKERGAYCWTVPQPTPEPPFRSPVFVKFDRQWRVLVEHNCVSLRYAQGVHPISVRITLLITRSTGQKECIRSRRPVLLKEGHSAQFPVEGVAIKTLTVKIDVIVAKKE